MSGNQSAPFTTPLRASLVEKSRQKPQERMRVLCLCDNDNADPLINSTGIAINTSFTQVEGHVLDPPKLKFCSGGDFLPCGGRWSFNNKELFNLEERIGNVSTGLSEDDMSKCLREKVYCGWDQNHEEVSCPICLEVYKNGNAVGRMEKCGHEYHVGRIKKWLMVKKLCPICKTECSNQQPNEVKGNH